jgi:hypothetical protein
MVLWKELTNNRMYGSKVRATARPVWSRGKAGDCIKGLPIATITISVYNFMVLLKVTLEVRI